LPFKDTKPVSLGSQELN